MAAGLPAEVFAPNRASRSFGSYLKELKARSATKVTTLAGEAGISRANYYLLEADKQRPSLSTAVALLGVLGVEASVPPPDDPDLDKDLDLLDGDIVLGLRMNWSIDERRRGREKFWTSAGVGLGAATGAGFVPWAAVRAAGLPVAAGASAVAAGLFPLSMPLAGVALAAKLLNERSRAKAADGTASTSAQEGPSEDVMADFARAAEEMSTDELEALLEAMKAMRDERNNRGG